MFYSIKSKLIVSFLLIVSVSLSIITFFNYRSTSQVLISAANEYLHQASNRTALKLDTFINNNLASITSESKLPHLAEFLESGLNDPDLRRETLDILETYREKDSVFINSYALLDRDGNNILDTVKYHIGQNESHRSYFKNPMSIAYGRYPYVSSLEFESAGTASLYFSHRIQNKQGQTIGVLRAGYSASVLQHMILKETEEKFQSFPILLDEHHIRLAYGSRKTFQTSKIIYKPITPLRDDLRTTLEQQLRVPATKDSDTSINLPDFEKALNTATTQSSSFFRTKIALGDQEMACSHTTMTSRPWIVIFVKPLNLLLEPTKQQTYKSLSLAFITACLTVFFAFVLAHKISKPVRLLTEVAQKVAAGDLHARVPLSSRKDETAVLGIAFNRMLDELADVLAKLKSYNVELDEKVTKRTSQLDQARQVLQSALDNSPAAMLIADAPDATISYINKAAYNLKGHSNESYRRVDDFLRDWRFIDSSGNEIEKEAFPLYRAIKDGVINEPEEVRLQIDDQSPRWLLCSAAPILNADGTVASAIAVFSDISAIKENEKQLVLAREAAENANQTKSEFLANMSHEIRTPMNSVLGFAEILKGKETDPKKSHYIESIYTSGKALLSLINDILDLSKIEAGKIELQYSSAALAHLFQELETIFSQKAKDKGIELSTVLPEELPAALVMDETRIRQILINLLGNAIKFTEQGTISLEAECHFPEKTHSEVQLEIRVRDSGIGIPAEQQAHIFEAFEQTKGQKVKQYGGTGLGLTICKRLVELMDGSLSVKSIEGEGSTFIIQLPQVEVAATRAETDPQMTHSTAIQFEPATILIADDIDYNREIIEAFLSEFNFTFLTAYNGIEALSQIDEHRPDLILMDMKMPDMDGYETSEKLKADANLKDIPIIAVTASALKEDEATISKICDGYLRKPVSQEELVTEIARHLPYTEFEAPAPIQNEAGNKAGNELPEMLASLAPDLRDQLYQAALDLDAGLIENLLDEHGDLPKELTDKIKELSRRFDFEQLQEMLNTPRESGGE